MHHPLYQLTEQGLRGEEKALSKVPRWQASEGRLMVTKRPVVLTGHELEVQNIKKVHPS